LKVAVTGAAGMLARALLPQLEAAGHEVKALRREQADVTSFPALRAAIEPFQPQWVLHLAAFTRVDDCERDVALAFKVNGLGARNAALAAAACGAALLAVSTDYVFDGRGTRPYREYDPTAPLSVYGKSKWAGEQAVREVAPRHVIVRTAWLYGAGGANFVDSILRKARHGEPLAVVDDQRGSPTWTYDLARALLRLVEAGGVRHLSLHQLRRVHVARAGRARGGPRARRRAGRTHHHRPALARPAPRPRIRCSTASWCEHVTGLRMPHWMDAVDRYLASGPSGN
jgi:dTDP-4-dehydrorhamnose reductase